MQYREIKTAMDFTTSLGMPSQTRVLDSRSYFFMTSSRSASVPTSASTDLASSSSLSFSLDPIEFSFLLSISAAKQIYRHSAKYRYIRSAELRTEKEAAAAVPARRSRLAYAKGNFTASAYCTVMPLSAK